MQIYDRLRPYLTLRMALIMVLLAGLALGVLGLLRASGAAVTPLAVRALLEQLGIWGVLALILGLAAVLVVPAVPASLLQLAAGLTFGPYAGLGYALLADALGASAGFWLARRWGSQLLERHLSPANGARLARLARRMSWRTVLLARLLPGPAYPLVSFAAGYSPLPFW